MSQSFYVLALAYILGLLLSEWSAEIAGIPVAAIALPISGLLSAFVLPQYWRRGPRPLIWIMAGLIGLGAIAYISFRTPHPLPQDISQRLARSPAPTEQVEVFGTVATAPQTTRSQRLRFHLDVTQVRSAEPGSPPQVADGKLYVTTSLLAGTGLYPGQSVRVPGTLYQPQPAENPGGFDFQQYLARQGIFAGLRSDRIDGIPDLDQSIWQRWRSQLQRGLWQIRQRIVRVHVQGAGSPHGFLISSMVLGRRAVDLPYNIYDQFTQIGMAHILAASGFHVSLLLGVVLWLTQRGTAKQQLIIGITVLVLYLGLTGLHPSVLRAGFMGAGALVGLTLQRRTISIAILVLAAWILLIVNPLWIWDIGFQFSFLATLGLMVMVPKLMAWLDFLPPAIASAIAVPIAAYLWILPVQLYTFGTLSLYTIPVNIAMTPLVIVISLGGMLSGAIALVVPIVGQTLAWVLSYPVEGLIQVVTGCNRLPGSVFAVGQVELWQLLMVYGLFGLLWWRSPWQRYWWLTGISAALVIVFPLRYAQLNQQQVTVLATSGSSVLIWQDHHTTGIINSGSEADVRFTILPFLRQQGINRLDWAIALDLQTQQATAWYRLLDQVPVRQFLTAQDLSIALNIALNPGTEDPSESTPADATHSLSPLIPVLMDKVRSQSGSHAVLSPSSPITHHNTTLQLLNSDPSALQVTLADHRWLILDELEPMAIATLLPLIESEEFPLILCWSGWGDADLSTMDLSWAIAARTPPESVIAGLQSRQVPLHQIRQGGAIQWTSDQGIELASSPASSL